MKVSIIGGGGRVGSDAAFCLQMGGIVREIALMDMNEDMAAGEALDLRHGAALTSSQTFTSGGYDVVAGSDCVVITAGLRRKPDESRLELINRNVGLFKGILDELKKVKLGDGATILVVSNPVDILTQLAAGSGVLPESQVIGLGTVLDTCRFRSLLADHFKVGARDVHALILGEHGDSMVPMWSSATVNGISLASLPGYSDETAQGIFDFTKKSGAEVIRLKGGGGARGRRLDRGGRACDRSEFGGDSSRQLDAARQAGHLGRVPLAAHEGRAPRSGGRDRAGLQRHRAGRSSQVGAVAQGRHRADRVAANAASRRAVLCRGVRPVNQPSGGFRMGPGIVASRRLSMLRAPYRLERARLEAAPGNMDRTDVSPQSPPSPGPSRQGRGSATPVVIALGSNLGDRLANMQRAVDLLSARLDVCKASRVYETAPMYVEDQPSFYNAAMLARCDIAPMALLRALKEVEGLVGRKPAERFGPREIDIDLVSYGCASYRFRADDAVVLQVPHPRTPERRFVLQPLYDLDPDLRLPGQPSLAEMLEATKAQAADVRIVSDAELSISGG